MALISINKDPSHRELRWFGIIASLVLAVLGGVIYWRFELTTTAYALWISAVVLLAVYYALVPLRKPIYLGYMYLCFPIGWTVSHVILTATYYLAITPLGVAMRLGGHDPMKRRARGSAQSYWIKRREDTADSRYFRQF